MEKILIKKVKMESLKGVKKLNITDDERNKRVEEVMDHVCELDKYSVQEFLSGMLDSYSVELAEIIVESEGDKAKEEAFELSRDIMNLVKQKTQSKSEGLSPAEIAKGVLAACIAFNTMSNAFDVVATEMESLIDELEAKGCDGNCKDCEHCDGVNFPLLVEHFNNKKIDESYIANMLQDGALSLNDVQEHFGNIVASKVLEIASKAIKEAPVKSKPKAKDNSDRVKKELEEFHALKDLVSKGQMSIEDFASTMDSYCKETQIELKKEADVILEKLVKDMGLPPQVVKAIVGSTVRSILK